MAAEMIILQNSSQIRSSDGSDEGYQLPICNESETKLKSYVLAFYPYDQPYLSIYLFIY